MLDYIRKDQVEVAPINKNYDVLYYLPHHVVKKHKDGGVKQRIVFDASSHEQDSPSLNDVLEIGPNLLPEILATLLRFRTYSNALVCDGNQAFLQLALNENDRDLTRFLWYRLERQKDENYHTTRDVISYRFKRLPFALTCNPFSTVSYCNRNCNTEARRLPTGFCFGRKMYIHG